MRTFYQITSAETGKVVLRSRKIAKALRRWLRGNGYEFQHGFYVRDSDPGGQFSRDTDHSGRIPKKTPFPSQIE